MIERVARAEQHSASGSGALPVALTTFVGRRRELEELTALVRSHRFVTATGPGGVGKTRLCVAVAGELANELPDGAVFVDLATVTDDAEVTAAVADAAGVPERAGADRADGLHAALRERSCLIVLDNCEHVLAGARACATDLISACPTLRLLATSRIRLHAGGEAVFAVPGLSIGAIDEDAAGDAVDLFAARVETAGGSTPLDASERQTARQICARLDGMALAIELAAARVPSFGVDGVLRALTESHQFLTLGHATQERHSSLRAAIDWSYHLLDDEQRALLRAVSVFAAPFDLDSAAAVTGRPATELLGALGKLVDWNLINLQSGGRSRYRVLETIRQHADERSRELAEGDTLHTAHFDWIEGVLGDLLVAADDDQRWRASVDRFGDDARAAIAWAASSDEHRTQAASLAHLLADLSFRRGRLSEAQTRYEQAAMLTDAGAERRVLLHLAAGSALSRYNGDQAIAVLQRIADQAEAEGAADEAAIALARIVTIGVRHEGTIQRRLPDEQTGAMLAKARQLSSGAPRVEAAIAVAAVGQGAQRWDIGSAERAVAMAVDAGDDLLADGARDLLTGAFFDAHQMLEAAAVVRARLGALGRIPLDAVSSMDRTDAILMAAHVDLSLGDLAGARNHTQELEALPYLRQEHHVWLARRIEVDALSGDFDSVVAGSDLFRDGWTRAGRPRASTLGSAAWAVAMVHGMRRNRAQRDEWLAIARAMLPTADVRMDSEYLWPLLFDGMLLLHDDDPAGALSRMTIDPGEMAARIRWYQSLWLPWYSAAWLEAACLVDADDVEQRLVTARRVASANPIAQLLIDRADALWRGEFDELRAIAEQLGRLGSSYQAQRTQRLHDERRRPGRAAGALSPLSDRELEVLELVATGRTNAQIAETLFISRKTAEHHVSNILTKLGVSKRSEAAALAGRHLAE